MTVRVLITFCAAGLLASGQELRREGTWWTQTVTGTAALEGATQVRVMTRGGVQVRGETTSQVSYSIDKRVRGGSPEEAKRTLAAFTIKTKSAGGVLYVAVEPPGRNNMVADVELMVPRSLKLVEAQTEGGTVTTTDLDGSVKATSGGGTITIDRIGGEAHARSGGGEIRLGRVTGAVHCQTGGGTVTLDTGLAHAQLETGGGDIRVREIAGALRASTGGGSIHVDKAAAQVETSTGGGVIEVVQAGGPVIAETGGGSIQIGSATGVKCETGAGAIRLKNVSGLVRASTGSGMILAELLTGARLENSALDAGSGDIVVVIPSNMAVTIRARSTSNRRIVSDFPEITKKSETRAEGSLNGGGPVLELSSGNGTIFVRRQK